MAKGNCCCCSKCGVALPKGVDVCCLCVCDSLCVTLEALSNTGTADSECGCLRPTITRINWDPDSCAYVGSISCGSQLSIDVRFEVKRCGGEHGTDIGTGTAGDGLNCHLCLTSACLGLDGVCGTPTGTSTNNPGVEDCQWFKAGNKGGDCGDYLKGCSQQNGWDETWIVDASECEAGSVDGCTQVSIHVECYPRTNPAGNGTDRLCKDCDCVCQNLEFDYEEDNCSPAVQIVAYEDYSGTGTGVSGWTATFVCSGGNQTILVYLTRGDDGCCYWNVSVSKGLIVDLTGSGSGATSDEMIVKTDCPEIGFSFEVDLGNGEFGLVDIVCAPCDTYIAINCCGILQAYAELEVTYSCTGGTDPFYEEFNISGSPGAGWGTSGGWGSDHIDSLLFNCVDGADGLSGIYTLATQISFSVPCTDTLSSSQEHAYPCCPLDLTFEFESECCGTIIVTIKTPTSIPCP